VMLLDVSAASDSTILKASTKLWRAIVVPTKAES
jgi:hypothetical protein